MAEAGYDATLARVLQEAHEAVEATPQVEVGSIFECSWGYDQTNVDFYLVVGLTKSGKSVRVQRIGSRTVDAHGPGGNRVVPNPEHVRGEVRTKRLRASSYHHWAFAARSFADAYLWDGQAQYETDSVFGH